MAAGPVDRQHTTPVVADEGDPALHTELVEQGVEVAAVVDVPVAARSGSGQLVRHTHADQVRRQAPATVRDPAEDVPPQVRRRGVAVQEHDGIAAPDLPIGHPESVVLRVPHRRHLLSLPHRRPAQPSVRCASATTRRSSMSGGHGKLTVTDCW
jgi:hypothetical protein